MRVRLKIILIFIISLTLLGQKYIYAQQLYFHHLTVDNGLPHNTVQDLVQDKYGFIWIATQEGLCRYDGINVKNYYADAAPGSPINNRPSAIVRDDDNNIWIAFSGRKDICRYIYESDNFQMYLEKNIPLTVKALLVQDKAKKQHISSNNYTWILQNQTLLQRNLATGATVAYPHLSNTKIKFLYRDATETLWMGTENAGIYYADTRPKHFYLYPSPIANDQATRAVLKDHTGNIWMGTQTNGVFVKAYNQSSFQPFNGLANKGLQVRRIFQDSKNNIWIGTRNGLYRYQPAEKKLHSYNVETDKNFPHNWVYAIYEDQWGIIWIGTWRGIASYNEKEDMFTPYPVTQTLPYNAVRDIIGDGHSGIWVATERGISHISYTVKNKIPQQLEAIKYIRDNKNPHTINDNFVYAIDCDKDGNLWIATKKGLCVYDAKTKQFNSFSTDHLLSNTIIRAVICRNDEVWASHQNGLTRIKNGIIRHFNTTDGLPFNEFSENARFLKNTSEEIFFGGVKGILSFNPNTITANTYIPKPVFTGLMINNKTVEPNEKVDGNVLISHPLYLTKKLTLPHQIKRFDISFAALHFAGPAKNKYAYRLIGADDNWRYTDAKNPTLSYAGLPAGNYIIELKAANSDGLWTTTPTVLAIQILPPWWLSPTAYIVYTLLLLLIVAAIVKTIIDRKNLAHNVHLKNIEAEKTKEIAQLKANFFTNVSHELRTPVTLIIDPVRKLMEEDIAENDRKKTYSLIQRNASRLLQLINQLLDFRKIESGEQQLHISQQDLIAFVRSRIDLFDWEATQRNIQLNFNTDTNKLIWGFDTDALDKVIMNLLSNAFKYTDDNTTITVSIITESADAAGNYSFIAGEVNLVSNPNCVAIRVADQGRGIAPEWVSKIFDVFKREQYNDAQQTGSGIGLALTRELILLHKGALTLQTTPGKGATFSVILPQDVRGAHEEIVATPVAIEFASLPDEEASVPNDNNNKPLALIVEDNNDIRHYLADALAANYTIIVAVNGQEGLAKAQELLPDIIVSDLMMPLLSGIDLCQQLKQDERTSHIPFILLTARQSTDTMITGYETGADDYIVKPFNLQLLRSRMANLIASRKQLRQLFSTATAIEIDKISINSADKAFITRAISVVEQYLDDVDFTPDIFATQMTVSRAQLFRKIKAMTNQTVIEFVTTIRLKKAAEFLKQGSYSVKEVAAMTGFSGASNFSRSFSKKYGIAPSDFGKS